MARPTKINYEIVERKINKLIENKINGDRFPTFSQIIEATGGNANSLNKFIKQHREKYNLLETNSIPLANSHCNCYNNKIIGSPKKMRCICNKTPKCEKKLRF